MPRCALLFYPTHQGDRHQVNREVVNGDGVKKLTSNQAWAAYLLEHLVARTVDIVAEYLHDRSDPVLIGTFDGFFVDDEKPN